LIDLQKIGSDLVYKYMDDRGVKGSWAAAVHENHSLSTILQRPLLLKIFCDWATMVPNESRAQDLVGLNRPVRLIRSFLEDYVNEDLKDRHLDLPEYSSRLANYKWDLEKISSMALRLHEECGGLGYEFERARLYDCITIADGDRNVEDALRIMVHKCPFIIMLDDKHCAFSHRTFYEFFVASGVASEVEEETVGQESFGIFDELVLNVDMRKFLADLICEKCTGKVDRWMQQVREVGELSSEDGNGEIAW